MCNSRRWRDKAGEPGGAELGRPRGGWDLRDVKSSCLAAPEQYTTWLCPGGMLVDSSRLGQVGGVGRSGSYYDEGGRLSL